MKVQRRNGAILSINNFCLNPLIPNCILKVTVTLKCSIALSTVFSVSSTAKMTSLRKLAAIKMVRWVNKVFYEKVSTTIS
jgi:hypothetical protein